jgi:HEAT repeat protein
LAGSQSRDDPSSSQGLLNGAALCFGWPACALGSFRNDREVGRALEAAVDDPDVNVRAEAARSLGQVMGEDARRTWSHASSRPPPRRG